MYEHGRWWCRHTQQPPANRQSQWCGGPSLTRRCLVHSVQGPSATSVPCSPSWPGWNTVTLRRGIDPAAGAVMALVGAAGPTGAGAGRTAQGPPTGG